MKWFRFYNSAIRDPKVASLSDKDFRLWLELLSVASDNDGLIPPEDELKRVLRRRLDYLKGGVKRLLNAGLVDTYGGNYTPHNWHKYQYKSDSSTHRVKKHRGECNVSETPQNRIEQNRTDNIPYQGSETYELGDTAREPFKIVEGGK